MNQTVPASGRVLVTVTSGIEPSAAGVTGYASFASSGGTGDVSASDDRSLKFTGVGPWQGSVTYLVSGLSAGVHTFRFLQESSGASVTFRNRSIIVIPLP